MFRAYLKRIRLIFIAFALFAAIFAAIFMLYRLEVEAILYAVLLCLPFAAFFLLFDFWRYRKKHQLLQQVSTLDLSGLPEPSDIIENDYQNLLSTLVAERRQVETRADQTRGDMMDYYALWAHQIKTPIAAMRLLLKEDALAQSSELFKIEQYVEMALHYLHLESGLRDFVFKSYALDPIIRSTIRKFARSFILKKIEFEFEPTTLEVITDEKWLSFILEQLVSNALKYTQHGHIRIYATEKQLLIEDTGIGIQPEDLPRIFEKGFTGYNGRESKKSTGLGLYLCKKILDALGHEITVVSKPGHGSTFSIDLSRGENLTQL